MQIKEHPEFDERVLADFASLIRVNRLIRKWHGRMIRQFRVCDLGVLRRWRDRILKWTSMDYWKWEKYVRYSNSLTDAELRALTDGKR